ARKAMQLALYEVEDQHARGLAVQGGEQASLAVRRRAQRIPVEAVGQFPAARIPAEAAALGLDGEPPRELRLTARHVPHIRGALAKVVLHDPAPIARDGQRAASGNSRGRDRALAEHSRRLREVGTALCYARGDR